jgi:predicted component of type VI protein secretion system
MPEKLFLTGSSDLERTWSVYGLGDFYRQIAVLQGEPSLPEAILSAYEARLKSVQVLIDEYTQNGWYK